MTSFAQYRVGNEHMHPVMLNTVEDEPGTFIENLQKRLKIRIISMDDNDVEFDLIGVDASIANALRRIMMAEVPTIAIEKVYIAANSSIIQDEVLAHRVGLVPILADANIFEFVGEEETDVDTVVFHLEYECPPLPDGVELDGDGLPILSKEQREAQMVFSKHLVWQPQGHQQDRCEQPIRPVHDNIVLAKLSPGQRIEFEAHACKGFGKDHTKFSPVATASYRLMPDIRLLQPVTDKEADQLKTMCPMGVFDIEDIGGGGNVTKKGSKSSSSSSSSGNTRTAVVKNPRDCTMCRECIRLEGWSDKVQLNRTADHFIFTVESTGCMPPETIVREALAVLKNKAVKFIGHAEENSIGGGQVDHNDGENDDDDDIQG